MEVDWGEDWYGKAELFSESLSEFVNDTQWLGVGLPQIPTKSRSTVFRASYRSVCF